MAMTAVNKMTAIEQTHLNFSHCISEKKLVQMSKTRVPGVPKGLKEIGHSCVICQHATIIRNNAAPAATGSDPHCISWDMIDMSKIPTVTGKRYCTMIVERKTHFAHILLHDSKSEDTIIQIFNLVLPLLTEKPIIVKSDCAPEYHKPKIEAFLKDVHGVKEMRHSNEHNQTANGMVAKFGDKLGRGLRVALLQSGLPLAFWGAAAIMVTDLYNSTPHSGLGGDSPYFRRTGRMPDMSFFRPFGCSMVAFRGKDLVEQGKLAPRGETGVCVGIRTHFGRRACISYSARTNQVYASVDCQFDTTLFPFQMADQRQRGFMINHLSWRNSACFMIYRMQRLMT